MRCLLRGAAILNLSIAMAAAALAAADKAKAGKSNSSGEGAEVAFDAERAYGYLTRICKIGARISGSEGMERQQQLLADHFMKLKAQVKLQSFDAPHPLTRNPVRMSNMIVSWDAKARRRVLLACHYDTRPHADRERDPDVARQATFLGANDGASGVALLMELGNQMHKIDPTYGVDLVFFDGEELIYSDARDHYFLGSEYFAKEYRDHPPEHEYVCGVVADMIGDKNLQIYQEISSLHFAPEVTDSIWKTAKKLNVKEFVAKPKHDVRDDHLALNQIAKIPTCDIIDFDYGPGNSYWHTTKDAPAACSGASLAKVGRVLLAWLESVPSPTKKPEKRTSR